MMNEESKSTTTGVVPPAALNIRETAIKYGFLVLLAGMVLYFSLVTGGFASPQSAVFILQSVSITGILALGVTATLVVGGFDASGADDHRHADIGVLHPVFALEMRRAGQHCLQLLPMHRCMACRQFAMTPTFWPGSFVQR